MEILRRIMSALLALVLIVTMLPLSALAEETTVDVHASGTFGDNLTWELVDGELIIRGEGDIPESSSAPWEEYCEDIVSVTLEKGITGIGRYVFSSCYNMSNIHLSEGVTWIGEGAFWGCPLTAIALPDSLKRIEDNAFYATGITEITIPKNVEYLGDLPFNVCFSLNKIWVEDGNCFYSSDEYGVLYNADKTQLVRVPCNFQGSYTVAERTEEIYFAAMVDCFSVTEVILPDSLTTIGGFAFQHCYELKEIVIPKNVKNISWCVFQDGGTQQVTFEGDFPAMDKGAFSGAIVTAHYPTNNPTWTADVLQDYEGDVTWIAYGDGIPEQTTPEETVPDPTESPEPTVPETTEPPVIETEPMETEPEVAYDASGVCGENLTWTLLDGVLTISGTGKMYTFYSAESPWYELREAITVISIENGITSIGESAFENCTSLSSIAIPDSITSIGDNTFWGCTSLTSITLPDSITSIGAHTFWGCTSLTSIALPDSIVSIGEFTFQKCASLTSITLPDEVASIGAYSFSLCTSLTSITFPNGETSIGEAAFWGCTSLSSIIFSDGKTSIGDVAFLDCTNLTSIILPDGISFIGKGAFENCISLTSIVFPNGETSIGEGAFRGCTGLTSIIFSDGKASVGDQAFWGCTSLSSIIFSDGETSIGNWAFNGCTSLTSITLPDSITSIGEGAFRNCSSLVSITLPDSTTSISRYTFDSCTSLISVTLPDSIISVGDRAFGNCTSLSSIAIPDSITSIGDYTFWGCTSLTNIMLPNGITSIGESAFGNCTSLSSIALPNGITSIGGYTFYDCTSLTNIMLPNGITSIGEAAFKGCTSLANVTLPDSIVLIGFCAFHECGNLKEIYYAGSRTQWKKIQIDRYNEQLTNANIHYNSIGPETDNPSNSTPSIPGYTINTWHDDFFLFIGDPYIYNLDSLESGLGMRINNIDVLDEEMLAPGDLTWTSSDESILRIIPDTADGDGVPQFEGLNTGTVTVTVTNPQGDSMSLAVEVVRPNELVFTNTYSSEQYHSSGGFYSATSAISDCIEIFIQFANHKKDRCPCTVTEELLKNVPVIAPITLTATVSGNDLSFERDSYQNTYTMTYDPLEFESSAYDLLMLFPVDKDTFCKEHTTYTVKVTLESESFVSALEETYTFTVYDLELLNAEEHIAFIEHDGEYLASKENIFGKGMAEILNNSPEYILSKWTTFDFDNYYDIVMADMLVGILDAPQNDFDAVPVILRNYQENYKKLVDGLYTIAKNDYKDVLDIGLKENYIDKMLKATKYETDGIYAEDAIYCITVDILGNTKNLGKIQKVFSGIDKLGHVSDLVEVGTDALNDVAAWMNTVAVMNAFKDMDDEMKQMFQSLVDEIPDNEKKMKEAVERYLNYSHDFLGQITEITESLKDTVVGIGLSTFKPFVGKMLWDCFAQKAVGLIGTISMKGASFSTTAAFSTLSAKVSAVMGPVGAVVTGVSLGFRVSDLICNSGDKAEEGSKVLAMSEYSPYIIEVLKKYEKNLYAKKNNSSVVLFENAFKLHQAAQSYIMDHTIKFLDEKASSWVQENIIGNKDCYDVAAEVLVCKNAIDNMRCCGGLNLGKATTSRKVIAIKCPVDVYMYDESDNEIIRILADTLEYAADGISVYIRDSEKYIALPADQEYSVKIIATDEGIMDYLVMEYDENLEMIRVLEKTDIPLVPDREFSGIIPDAVDIAPEDYALSFENTTFVPTEPEQNKEHEFSLGDPTHDGSINAKDSTRILQFSVGALDETIFFCEDCAKVSDDDDINAKDSTLILQYTVGQRDTFPAQK